MLSGFKRVLKKDGMLMLGVKIGEGERYKENYETKRFFAFYKPDEIKTLVDDAGFEVLAIYTKQLEDNWIMIFARKP